MPQIFLSHSASDELEAVAVKGWLTDNGWEDVFLDVDPERGLAAGARWQEALRRAADRCEAVVFVVSPAWARSKWCLAEFLLAKNLNKLIFGLVLKDVPINELPTEMTSEWQLCSLVGVGPSEVIHFTHRGQSRQATFLTDGLNRLRAGLQRAGIGASFFQWPPKDDESRSPYRGLEPLDSQDAAVFFGRDGEILQALDALRGMRAAGNQGLFVILGASGAGKSSFLRAGLLPRLARDDRHFLVMPIVRPERQPLSGERGLAQSISKINRLLHIEPANPGDLKAALTEGSARFGRLLRDIQQSAHARLVAVPTDAVPPTLVLPVDQAEELFSDDATRESHVLLDLIGTALRDSQRSDSGESRAPMIVVFTIRSDRYEPLQTASELTSLRTVVFDALRPMPAAQFKEVIVGPAARAMASGRRVEFAPDLVSQLLADCARGADTLPLLSLTLARLYTDYGSDGDLRLDEYKRMGGMADVIQTEAESILSTDPAVRDRQLDLLHAAFIPWLATINADDDQPLRRIARMSDLPAESRPLVSALIEKRLLLSDLRDGETILEVAHESLLRQWNSLADWLRTERDDLKEADRLEQGSAAWTRNGKKTDWLIEGERLDAAETLATKPAYRHRLERVSEFLAASRQRETLRRAEEARAQQAELKAAQERQAAAEVLAAEQERAATRAQADAAQLRRRGKQLAGLVATATVVAAFAVWFAFEARQQSALARQQFAEATALRITAEAQAIQAGTRAGGTVAGLLKLLAARQLATRRETEGEMLAQVLSLGRLERIIEFDGIGEALAFSRDGTRIVSLNGDGILQVWDAKSGQRVGTPMKAITWGSHVTYGGPIVAFSPDGTRIVAVGDDNILQLWDATHSKHIGGPMKGHRDRIRGVAFSPDGTRVVSASHDTTLQLWDGTNGQAIGAAMTGHTNWVTIVAFSPDGTQIASGSSDGTVRLWDSQTGRPLGLPMRGHQNEVSNLAFTPDGTKIASLGDDNTLTTWDATTRMTLGTVKVPERVNSVAFQDDGTLVLHGYDGTLRLMDTDGKAIGMTIQTCTGHTTVTSFDHDATRIVMSCEDKTLRIVNADIDSAVGTVLRGHEGNVHAVAFSPDATRAVSGGADETLRRWDVGSGQPIGEPMTGHGEWVQSVAYSPDGTRIVSGSADGTLRLWEARDGRIIGPPMRGHERSVQSVAFSPDGARIVSGSADKTLRLWNAKTGEALGAAILGHEGAVQSVEFSPDGTRILSGSSDKTVRLWDAQTLQPLGVPMRSQDEVGTAVFNFDATRIASVGDSVLLWDAKNQQLLGELAQGPDGRALTAAFGPDGTWIVVTNLGKTLRVWDVERREPIGPQITGHDDLVFYVAASRDGTRIASASGDVTIRLWPAPKIWADILCAKLSRNMSQKEWAEWVSPNIEYRVQCPGLPVPAAGSLK